MARPQSRPSTMKRVHVDFDRYIRQIGDRVYQQTGQRASETELTRMIPKIAPPNTILIVREPSRKKKTTMLDVLKI